MLVTPTRIKNDYKPRTKRFTPTFKFRCVMLSYYFALVLIVEYVFGLSDPRFIEKVYNTPRD